MDRFWASIFLRPLRGLKPDRSLTINAALKASLFHSILARA